MIWKKLLLSSDLLMNWKKFCCVTLVVIWSSSRYAVILYEWTCNCFISVLKLMPRIFACNAAFVTCSQQ
uniref:Uncharacterized protein n=1 Tax=Arundo donax TaxID=35708 RepID=A0A0A8Y5C2_ARUDO